VPGRALTTRDPARTFGTVKKTPIPLADKQFALLKADPRHPSLRFKRGARFRSVPSGRHYRPLAVEVADGLLWWWIGTHGEHDRLVG